MVVFVVMGIIYEEVNFFKKSFEEIGVIERVVLFFNLVDDLVIECIIILCMVFIVVEYFVFDYDM